MGFDIHRNGQVALFLRLIRGHGEPDFGANERNLLELLKPPMRELAAWLENTRSFTREHNLHEQAFSSLVLGSIILDADLHIVYMNSVAEQLLDNNPAISRAGNKLRVIRHQEHQQIRQAVAGLLSGDSQGLPQVIPIARQGGHSPLFLTLRQLPLQERLDSEHHIAVYMTDPELRQIDQTQLVVEAFWPHTPRSPPGHFTRQWRHAGGLRQRDRSQQEHRSHPSVCQLPQGGSLSAVLPGQPCNPHDLRSVMGLNQPRRIPDR